MLHEDEIRRALRAGRVVPLTVPNPHGPASYTKWRHRFGAVRARPTCRPRRARWE